MKRALAVAGFTMLSTLLVFCNIKNDITMSVAIIASLVVLLLFLLIKPVRKDKTLPTAMLSVFIALLLLFLNNSSYFKNAVLYSNKEITVSGVLSSLPYEKNGNTYYIIKTDTINGNEEKLNIRISSSSPVDLKPTDRVTVTIKSFLLGTTDDDILNYYKSRDLFLGGFPTSDWSIEKNNDLSVSSRLLNLQSKMINSVISILPNDYGGITTGLVIGDTNNISDRASNAFLACGVTHLFVVSGLHMSVWSMLFYAFAKKLRMSNKSASLVSVFFCIFFMILTGCIPPVVRSGIMMIIIYLSNIFDREADAFNSIGLSLVLMLFFNPYNALSVSLWLSLLATMGILLLFGPVSRFLDRPVKSCRNRLITVPYKALTSVIAVSVAVTLFTLPVYILKLKTISTLLIFSNLIMVSLGSLCMTVGGIGCMFLTLGIKFIGTPLILFCGIISKLLLRIALFFSQFRYTLIPVYSNYSKIILAVCALIIAFIFLKNIKNKKTLKILSASMTVLFIAANLSVITINHNQLQMTVADVGNGMSVILKYKGRTAILGCGGDYYAESSVCDIIKSYASTTIDYLILPDSSKYSTSEANDILNSYNVGALYLNDPDELNRYSFNGEVYSTDKSVISLFNNEVIIAVEDKNDCCLAQIVYGNFKAVVSFKQYNSLPGGNANLLICRKNLPSGVNPQDFNMVVVSTDNNDKIWQAEYADNICTTSDNSSISFLIRDNGTFTDWRAT